MGEIHETSWLHVPEQRIVPESHGKVTEIEAVY